MVTNIEYSGKIRTVKFLYDLPMNSPAKITIVQFPFDFPMEIPSDFPFSVEEIAFYFPVDKPQKLGTIIGEVRPCGMIEIPFEQAVLQFPVLLKFVE